MSEFGGLWQHTHNQARTISDKNNLIIVVSQRTEEEENTHTHTKREREREGESENNKNTPYRKRWATSIHKKTQCTYFADSVHTTTDW